MKVVAVVSSKGGVGKTTLASALAVRATRESKRVAMVDMDPMGSLAAWWKRRGSTDNPCIFRGADTAEEAIEILERDGWDWVFIDTPPAFLEMIEGTIASADLALIPLRASALDLIASEDAVLMAREASANHLCVVNDAEPRWKTTHSARDYLLAASVPLAQTIITHRVAYLGAMTSGKTGPEVERDGQAKKEIDALWTEIKASVRKTKRARQ